MKTKYKLILLSELAIIVTESQEIKKKEHYLNFDDYKVLYAKSNILGNVPYLKVVATTNPDYYDRLPSFHNPFKAEEALLSEEIYHKDYNNKFDLMVGFERGYNKAKEKYKFTEEDIKKAMFKASLIGFKDSPLKMDIFIDNYIYYLNTPKTYSVTLELNYDGELCVEGNQIIIESYKEIKFT